MCCVQDFHARLFLLPGTKKDLMMKLKDDDSGFVITSKKINENKYTVYLIDPKSETYNINGIYKRRKFSV